MKRENVNRNGGNRGNEGGPSNKNVNAFLRNEWGRGGNPNNIYI